MLCTWIWVAYSDISVSSGKEQDIYLTPSGLCHNGFSVFYQNSAGKNALKNKSSGMKRYSDTSLASLPYVEILKSETSWQGVLRCRVVKGHFWVLDHHTIIRKINFNLGPEYLLLICMYSIFKLLFARFFFFLFLQQSCGVSRITIFYRLVNSELLSLSNLFYNTSWRWGHN